ncbi:hypothetical protein [Microcoleus sp. B3-D7]|uniref:hypothetical protein n=1 Tax=Microcoleus sp. B3-D7 TaxID=2818659 RepID=UPI002FD4A631
MSNNFYALILPLRETQRLLSLGQFLICREVRQRTDVRNLTRSTDVDGRSAMKDFPLSPTSIVPITPHPHTPYPHHPLLSGDRCHLTMPVRSHQATEDVYML